MREARKVGSSQALERSYFLERAPSTILCKPRATILMASNEPTVLPRRPRCKKSSQQKWSGYAPAWLPVALGGAGIANSDLMLHRQVPRVNVGLNKRLDRFGDHKLRLGSPKRNPLASLRMCGGVGFISVGGALYPASAVYSGYTPEQLQNRMVTETKPQPPRGQQRWMCARLTDRLRTAQSTTRAGAPLGHLST